MFFISLEPSGSYDNTHQESDDGSDRGLLEGGDVAHIAIAVTIRFTM